MPNSTVPAAAEGVPAIKNPPLDRLSFVSRRHVGGGFDYWCGVPAGRDYSEDCETGERLAEEFIDFISKFHSEGSATLLGSIMLGMEESKAPRGQKIGFMNTINRYAMVGGYAAGTAKNAPAQNMTVRKIQFLNGEDLVYECAHLSRLVFNSIEGLELDADLKSLSAGINIIEKKLHDAAELFEFAKRSPDSGMR